MTDILEFFPFEKPEGNQPQIIRAIDKAFKDGFRFVVLEAPVGSGKSPIAMTLARAYGGSHTLTPKKALQDQYYADFHDFIVTMKGRSSYPCMPHDMVNMNRVNRAYLRHLAKEEETVDKIPFTVVESEIFRGNSPRPWRANCGNAPCQDDDTGNTYEACTEHRGCPYDIAIDVALSNPHIIHNFHSFIFQTHFTERFSKRQLLIIDEAHNTEGIVRDFFTTTFTLLGQRRDFQWHKPRDQFELEDWTRFFSDNIRARNILFKDDEEKEAFINKVLRIEEYYTDLPVTIEDVEETNRDGDHVFKINFIPHKISHKCEELLYQYGDHVLIMSGTIYDKDFFCRQIGIPSSEAVFLRVESTFPKENRPIYAKDEYMVDTSFARWDQNFDEMIAKIKTIMNKDGLKNVKGLIHAPSYFAAHQVANALRDTGRILTHEREDFQDMLDLFMRTPGNQVFISPNCTEGVDFKGDRARFQMILRVPYPSMGSEFNKDMSRMADGAGWQWLNHQALVTFGQQIGRVVRGPEDHGVTVLMDARFKAFLKKNWRLLPQWLKASIIMG